MNFKIYKPIKCIVKMIRESIGSEIYDMMDYFTVDEITEITKNLIIGLRSRTSYYIERDEENKDYCQIKVRNSSSGSFVSFSDEGRTGLSRCLVRILKNPKKPEQGEVKTLLDMINEAYYLCKNQ